MNSMRVKVTYSEWLTIEDVENEAQALRVAHDVTVDEYGQAFADYASYELEG